MTPNHKALGFYSIARYAAISDRFMGASPYFINSTLAGVTATAGLDFTHLKEDEDMPFTDADAQTVAKTQIIIPDKRWTQSSVAETLAGTRIRAEDNLEAALRIEGKLDKLLKLLGK
jgi:hypothetical protein